jgi:hypothetical protein
MSAPRSLTFNSFLLSDQDIVNEYNKLKAFHNQASEYIQDMLELAEVLMDERGISY